MRTRFHPGHKTFPFKHQNDQKAKHQPANQKNRRPEKKNLYRLPKNNYKIEINFEIL